MTKVSIILPIYNVEQYLAYCINSFITTLPEDCEVILVNDGSTDGSLNICEEFKGKYPELVHIINKENGGLSDARNVGTAAAKGEYIYYLDSDDWISPYSIKKLYHFAIKNKCEVVQGGFYYAYDNYLLYDDRWVKDTDAPFVLDRNEAMHQLILNNYIKNFAWGKLYRADIVKTHPFPKGRYFEDSYWQHLIMNEVNHYGLMTEPIYFYRQRVSGISGAFSKRNLDLLIGYRQRINFVDKNYPQFSNELHTFYRNLCINFNEHAMNTGKEEIIRLYADYLHEEGIRYNHIIYQIQNFAKMVYDHFFAKKLKIIEL